jgi:hypothetical protein
MEQLRELPKYPPLFFVRFSDRLRRGLVKISRRFTHPNVIMLEHLQNLWLLGAISAANELGIADILAGGPKTIGELASLTGALEDPLYRIMRMLSSEGIFRESGNREFSNTKISASMKEEELRFFIQHTLTTMQFKIFSELIHSARTGRRSSELFVETGMFEHMGKSKHLNELYNKAMTNTSKMQLAAILSSFKFNRFSNVIDVAGGQGYFLSALLSKYRNMHGILFDLPQVVEDPRKLPDMQQFEGRLTAVAGSFFNEIPSGGDLYTLKNILHGWNEEDCIRILKNIRKAINPEGKVMVIEALVEGRNKPSWGKMSDVFMMAGLDGRERTREEFASILEKSGFRLEQVKKTVSPLSLIIASPSADIKD